MDTKRREDNEMESKIVLRKEIEMEKYEALNTLAKLFHNGEEMEGEDGMVMIVDLVLWNEGYEALESLIGGEDDDDA